MKWINKYILQAIQRYSISNEEERTDAVKATIFLAFVHVLISFWIWVIFDRTVPEHIFLAFSGIVIGALGFDTWRSNTINITSMKGSNPNIDNPDGN